MTIFSAETCRSILLTQSFKKLPRNKAKTYRIPILLKNKQTETADLILRQKVERYETESGKTSVKWGILKRAAKSPSYLDFQSRSLKSIPAAAVEEPTALTRIASFLRKFDPNIWERSNWWWRRWWVPVEKKALAGSVSLCPITGESDSIAAVAKFSAKKMNIVYGKRRSEWRRRKRGKKNKNEIKEKCWSRLTLKKKMWDRGFSLLILSEHFLWFFQQFEDLHFMTKLPSLVPCAAF